jgi:hypothetical protein
MKGPITILVQNKEEATKAQELLFSHGIQWYFQEYPRLHTNTGKMAIIYVGQGMIQGWDNEVNSYPGWPIYVFTTQEKEIADYYNSN